MRRVVIAAACWATAGVCQVPPKETDTLRALLMEVHQLRQEIEAVTVASQRVQIALYSLQMQDSAVGRAARGLDDLRNKCSAAAAAQQVMALDAQRTEAAANSGTLTPSETKDLQAHLTMLKTMTEQRSAEVQTCREAEAEASNQLRSAQGKMTELQDRIERLDKSLEKMAVP